ncbi:NlpC/P60 family protein [Brooklawnia cerclae]|uniref:NlpC/P60 domain-containing protein n=1 Tax=Brooklawnia cerclae TaxID=349934 RepID=A0ABX0SED1_9ACTN|nr:NlpC/P60 family protein [Brooklawnia cerclae]NIH56234.1 hypothetical protein [Brooklawnia cerclae]
MSTAVQDRLVAWMRDRQLKYYYTQDMTARSQPDVSGGTDCSALVEYCYKQVAGIEVGSWTGGQQSYGVQVFGDEADYATAVSLLQPGDLVFFDWDGVGIKQLDHVEMYMGAGQTIGHGGPGNGPTVKGLKSQWDAAHTIVARRYVDVTTQAPAPAPASPAPAPAAQSVPGLPQPFPLPRSEYYGLISGPNASHGGYYEAERPVIRIIQQRLIAKGYVPGITDIGNGWADGIFEQPTADAVARFQRAEMPGTQYYGQVWWDDYAQLSK